jgi:hypothetical protein
MTFFRKFTRRQWLAREMILVLGAIASSIFLSIAIPSIAQQTAQSLQPFTGTPAPKLAYFDRLVSLVDRDDSTDNH